MVTYQYGGFRDEDARSLSCSIAAITTHDDPETGQPGESHDPYYVLHVVGKPYLMLLPKSFRPGNEIYPVHCVFLIDVATVTVHQPTAA